MESYDTHSLRQVLDMYDRGTIGAASLAGILAGEGKKVRLLCRCDTKECCAKHNTHVMPHVGCVRR